MKDFPETREVQKTRARVLRLYGMQRLTSAQHNVAIRLLEKLELVLADPEAALREEGANNASTSFIKN